MSKAMVLLGLTGAGFLVWGIGISIRLWANPIFAYFWVENNNIADALSYFGSGIGALLLALSMIIYYRNSNRRTDKTCIVMPSQTSKLAMSEFYEDYWQKKLLQQTEADNVEYHPFIIINGTRANLGSEVMEKIVS